MSIYGPKIRLPQINLPKLDQIVSKKNTKILLGLLVLILIIATLIVIFSNPIDFNQHITVSWVNNPLKLINQTDNLEAELRLTILNNSETTKNITLEVISESEELIIYCPYIVFPNVAPNHKRETMCIIRRNPSEDIFSGTYKLEILTNLGRTSTTLEIKR